MGHEADVEEFTDTKKFVWKIFAQKELNIQTEFKVTHCQVIEWIHKAQDKVNWRDVLRW